MSSAIARRTSGYSHEVEIRGHSVRVDEPEDNGGADTGPKPTELLAAALASCTAITVEMYAERKGWDLGEVEVRVDYEAGPREELDSGFDVALRLPADLEPEQVERILRIAGKCPVHRALTEGARVRIADRLEQD